MERVGDESDRSTERCCRKGKILVALSVLGKDKVSAMLPKAGHFLV